MNSKFVIFVGMTLVVFAEGQMRPGFTTTMNIPVHHDEVATPFSVSRAQTFTTSTPGPGVVPLPKNITKKLSTYPAFIQVPTNGPLPPP